jgi:predicted outer membrane repeat protein
VPALAVFGLSAPPAWSVPPCQVTTTDDSGPGSLRQALLDLDLSNGGFCREIILPSTGTLTLKRNLPTVHWPFTLTGPGPSAFTIDGAGHSILRADLPGAGQVKVSGVTMRGADGGLGPAIYLTADAYSTGLTVSDAVFTGNTATSDGGAISVIEADLTISGSTMTSNVSEGSGGAIAAIGDTTVLIDGLTFDGNQARYNGGAVSVNGVEVTVRDSTFTSNSGYRSGGAYLNVYGTGEVTGSVFVGNSSQTEGGGLTMYGQNPEDPRVSITVSTSTFSQNVAGTEGGGAEFGDCSDLTVVDSTFDHNTAKKRGGGLIVWDFDDWQTFRNVTITKNRAAVGGGVMLRKSTDATFEFSTIANNKATSAGGGIATDSKSRGLAVAESILYKNRAPSGADIKDTGKSLRVTSSLLTSRRSVSSRVRAVLSKVLTGVNPRLGRLADNGGPTKTMLPAPKSRVINAGPARVTDAPANDQRGDGHPRLLGKRYDLGSIEVR